MSEERLHVVGDDDVDGDGTKAPERVALATVLADLSADEGALVPVAAVAPMVTAIVDAIGQAGSAAAETSMEVQRQALRTEALDEARTRFRLSRVGSGSAAALFSGLWMLPQLVSAFGGPAAAAALQASLLAPLFALPLFDPVVFGLALYSWLFFGLTWLMEQNDLRRIDWVTTDAARTSLLRRAVLRARQRGEQDSITKADIRAELGRGLRPTFALRLLGARDVTASFLDRVTSFHVSELSAQGVLAPSRQASLSPRYLVAEAVSREVQP